MNQKFADKLDRLRLSIDSNDDINTEGHYSAQKGGFLWGSSKNDDKILKAAKEHNYQVVEFMLDNNMVSKFDSKDNEGMTLLHRLIEDNANPKSQSLIDKLLSGGAIKSFINAQDNNGNTPIISATKCGATGICDKLVNAGADLNIRNKEGKRVKVNELVDNDIQAPVLRGGKPLLKFLTDFFTSAKAPAPELSDTFMTPASINLSDTNEGSIVLTVDVNTPELSVNSPTNQLNSEQFIQAMETKYARAIGSTAQSGGIVNMSNRGEESFENINSDAFADLMDKKYNDALSKLSGGAKGHKQAKGHRQLVKYQGSLSDISVSVVSESAYDKKKGKKLDVDSEEEPRTGRAMSRLERLLKNQKDEIHDRVVKKIMELLKVDEITARAYKAILYKEVKEKYGDKSGFDRATELEKLTTLKELKKADPKLLKEIKETIAKKEAERSERLSQSSSEPKSASEKPKKKEEKKAVKKPVKKTTKKGKTEDSLNSPTSEF